MFEFGGGALVMLGIVAFLEYTDNALYAKFKSWVKKVPDPAAQK